MGQLGNEQARCNAGDNSRMRLVGESPAPRTGTSGESTSAWNQSNETAPEFTPTTSEQVGGNDIGGRGAAEVARKVNQSSEPTRTRRPVASLLTSSRQLRGSDHRPIVVWGTGISTGRRCGRRDDSITAAGVDSELRKASRRPAGHEPAQASGHVVPTVCCA